MTRNRNDGIRKVCGCPRDKWPKCPHGWRMNFKWKGVHHRYALDRLLAPRQVRSKTEAENEAERIRTEIREDRFREPGAAADDRPVLSTLTLTELLDTFERRYLKPERAGSSLRNAKYEIAAIQRTVVTLPTGMARPLGDWSFRTSPRTRSNSSARHGARQESWRRIATWHFCAPVSIGRSASGISSGRRSSEARKPSSSCRANCRGAGGWNRGKPNGC
jgi:hypothetical protein